MTQDEAFIPLQSSAAPIGGKSCDGCDCGWTCEQHPGTPWPHITEDEWECAGPGMPCLNGCLELPPELQR